MSDYGAAIERGRIISAEDDGYRVMSYSRGGITTPPLPAISDATYKVDDRVYFFVFSDGHGAILAAFD